MVDGLEGLTAIVTASGGGAGFVIAQRLHQAGARVIACDIDANGLARLSKSCPGIVALQADAGDEGDVSRVVAVAEDRIDILVNNAGISGPTAAVEDLTLNQWNTTLRINLTSQFLFARAVVRSMKASNSGLIVNISSGSAKVGLPLRLPYVVSKGAVLSLTSNLARELGPHGIRVNAILPGAIRGERITRVFKEKAAALDMPVETYVKNMMRYISLRSMVEPEDIAAMVLFLAGPGGQRISGQMIGVDGNVEWEE